MKIFAFTWNTQSHRLTESLDPEIIRTHRDGYFHLWNCSGQIPNFWTSLQNLILNENPDIVVISFQEDVSPGSYFHSHFLPDEMPKLGYQLFERSKQMGLGKTTFNGLSNGDIFTRGLRISVYVSANINSHCSKRISTSTYTNSVFQNKGAIAIYLTLGYETVALINSHLPFHANSLTETVKNKDMMIRQDALFEQNQFFNQIYRDLILDKNIDKVLFMGDLNYRYFPFVDWSAELTGKVILEGIGSDTLRKNIRQNDELYHQMIKKNIYCLDEGVDNSGPTFPPTGKMKKFRNPNPKISDYSLGKFNQRVPSHCDRILHLNLNCLKYERFDTGMMDQSDHAGVYGLYVY